MSDTTATVVIVLVFLSLIWVAWRHYLVCVDRKRHESSCSCDTIHACDPKRTYAVKREAKEPTDP